MKTLGSLKLNKLVKEGLQEREMNQLRGGGSYSCGCGCHYEGKPYGATTRDNIDANAAKGPGGAVSYGGSKYCYESPGPGEEFKPCPSFN